MTLRSSHHRERIVIPPSRRGTATATVTRWGDPDRRSVLVLSGMDGAPLAAQAVVGDAVWDALVAAGVTPEPYAEPTPPPDGLVPLSVVAERLKAAGVWEAIVAIVFDPANRAALADLIMVQQGIAPNDPVARALISAAGAD
jgi:hypothetical protein